MELKERASMIWTPDGVWLQTFDQMGAMKLSGCGKIALHSVEFFCASRGIPLLIKTEGAREIRPGRTAQSVPVLSNAMK